MFRHPLRRDWLFWFALVLCGMAAWAAGREATPLDAVLSAALFFVIVIVPISAVRGWARRRRERSQMARPVARP